MQGEKLDREMSKEPTRKDGEGDIFSLSMKRLIRNARNRQTFMKKACAFLATKIGEEKSLETKTIKEAKTIKRGGKEGSCSNIEEDRKKIDEKQVAS